MKKAGSSKPKRERIVWDEDNLEHNKTLQTATMKIDEPKTPWASPTKEEMEEDCDVPACVMDSIEGCEGMLPPAALQLPLPGSEAGPSRAPTGWDSSDDEEGTSKGQATGNEDPTSFAAKRKAHYNEAEALRRAKELAAQEDEEED
ncbi:hypothetical protein CYMTET_14255 [Cymbomonas tetramitiformis]|uniref:Protein phosphatase inhibitor 2 n=1 Tax=Cymbomonas tetramitiformis TaxID=36881 RepID=A0AAE0LA26_9CHLO|nr:hypothetical protein CYMTET_14255 [Cymbomonas tetramitiformis]